VVLQTQLFLFTVVVSGRLHLQLHVTQFRELFDFDVSESKILQLAHDMVSTGLAAAGYTILCAPPQSASSSPLPNISPSFFIVVQGSTTVGPFAAFLLLEAMDVVRHPRHATPTVVLYVLIAKSHFPCSVRPDFMNICSLLFPCFGVFFNCLNIRAGRRSCQVS